MKDLIVTMHEDLERALGKSSGRRWGMLIDLRKCVGCHACTVSCMSENKLPPGVVYRPVHEYERGKFPAPVRTFLPRPCMHCDNPPCVPVCPTKGKATWKETKGIGAGTVKIDYKECIGCGACVDACPYKARSMDGGKFYTGGKGEAHEAYETCAAYEYGTAVRRKDGEGPIGNARKCHFCVHRLGEGMLPQCVTTCIGRATLFGDLDDPQSEIAKAIKANKVQTLKTKKGTKPRVFYIAEQNLEVLYV
jgi:molybdopterin-containing oxidoreductase family iron-sulfur binding subunit